MLLLLYFTWFFRDFQEFLFLFVLSQQLLILLIYLSRVVVKLYLKLFFGGYQLLSLALIPQFFNLGVILFNSNCCEFLI